MSTPRLATIEEAADLLGVEGRQRLRRTRRMLAALGRQTQRTILVRFGGEGHGTRYRVSLPQLREAMPGLIERPVRTTATATKKAAPGSLADVREDLREWILSHDAVHERVEDRLDELFAMIQRMARQVGDRLAALERPGVTTSAPSSRSK